MIEIDPAKQKPFDLETFRRVFAAYVKTPPEPQPRWEGWWYEDIADLDQIMPELRKIGRENLDAAAAGFVAALGCTPTEAHRFAHWCTGYR